MIELKGYDVGVIFKGCHDPEPWDPLPPEARSEKDMLAWEAKAEDIRLNGHRYTGTNGVQVELKQSRSMLMRIRDVVSISASPADPPLRTDSGSRIMVVVVQGELCSSLRPFLMPERVWDGLRSRFGV